MKIVLTKTPPLYFLFYTVWNYFLSIIIITERAFLCYTYMNFFFYQLQFLQKELRYEITGDGLASTLFRINPETGLITLAQSLESDESNTYVVSVSQPLTLNSCNVKYFYWEFRESKLHLLSIVNQIVC